MGRTTATEHALETYYDQYAGILYGYVRSLGASAALAEDVIQQVFMRLARRLKKGPIRNPKAFLLTVARREFYRWTTQVLRRLEISAGDAKGYLEPASGGAGPEEAAVVEDMLSKLPEAQREAVFLKVYGGLTFEEIATAMDTSINTAASRYRYGIEKLRALYPQE